MGNFGADMLYRYQQEDRRILDAEEMVGAASRPAHEKGQYLDAHTQPLPSPPLLPPIPLGVQSPMTSLSNTTADIAYQKSKSSSDGTTQGAASASSPPVRTVETIGGPTPPAPDPALAAAAAAANAAKPVTLSNTEATQLLSRLDKDPSIPDDAANANSLAGLQRDSMRSADSEAIGFEQQAIQANQEVEALPSQQRDFYRGALAAGTTYYNAAITQEQREKIAHAVRTDVIDPISRAYLQAMADPNARVQMAFSKPFGSVYLGAAGMQQVDLLAEMGQQFNRAATAEERARIFEQAADLRHVMQSQIASFVDQERSHVQEQWKQADKEINQALAEAKGMWVASAESGLDDTSSFERLNWFMNHGLNSERNAQEFQYRLSKSPDNFKLLHEWSADASKKAEWATSALQSDLFRRAPVLPPLPPDPTQTNIDNLRMGNFGGDLLYRYQLENRSIVDAMNMYHAASQHGPIQDSYLNAHTPPLPLWQQQLEDGFGRFFVGLIPVANLLVDYIVPAKSLPEWARQGIDFASGVVGMLMGEANFPKFGGAKGLNVSEFKPFEPVPVAGEASAATEAKPAPSFWQWLNDLTPKDPKLALANKVSDLDAAASPKPTEGSSIEPKPPKEEIKPGEGNAKNEPANAPKPEITTPVPGSTAALSGSTSGIPLVPEEYARPPSGKLTPDPNYRGLYRDEGGQNYIQQDGKTYPVTWNDDARSWQMMPREGSPNAPKMHINEKGNWEVNLDTGLTGGARSSKTAFYKHAFDLYESGKSFREIGKELGIEPPTAKRWIEAYLQQSGDMQPVRVGGQLERIYMGRGENIYQSFREGRSLPDVAQRYTDGDEFAAYRSGMRYANANDLLTDLIPQNRPWRNPPERAANQLRYPMSYQQSADIAQGYEEGKTDAQISQETHVREQWIKDMRGKRGNYSHKDQEWIQDVDDVDPAEATRQQPGARGEPGNTGEQPRLGMDDATQQPPPRPDKKLRLGQIADGRRAFNLYENGKTMSEIARELDINPATASAWVNRYLRESGDVWPRQAGGYSDKVYFPSGGAIYRELAEGRPLAEVANKFTGGDELQAIRSGTRFADREGLPSNVIPQDKPWRIRPEREYAEPGGIGPVQPELGGHSRPGQIEDLRAAFDRYERGDTFAEIGHEFNVHRDTARNWVEKYIRESGEVTPLEVRSHKAATHLWLGAPIYGELSRGTPLQEVADRFTDGNALASLHSAMRYAREQHLPTGMLLENRPWRIPQEGAPNTLSYAITPEQYDKILLANRQQKPTWLISEETGVPREWVARIKSEQGWAERGNLGELGEPQAKRRRTDVAPGDTGQAQPEDSGATQQPQTGTGGGTQQTETGTGSTTQQEPATSSQSEPSWGSKQLQQFSEDHTKLSKAEADSIDAWFNGHGPAPQSLQAELTARGYSDITPEMVRIFFTQRNPGLSARQIDRILRFIFM
ncbi:helix-turn-helix domain-containing protein [Caballeronia sp. LZ034LL]|uniref:helix-turn-helix domain-containing protein n=1 Tax=Caballeronia sp. LZ034LL TaxID=3038567 RepID=UPI00285F495D|nr:helix-turn-helix domain-containing protein [Caballeronia sp. LZ034LL]MDR5839452.1 helix-turn-helix domain-containing protein [Caballeronia sp. LZ034LL]